MMKSTITINLTENAMAVQPPSIAVCMTEDEYLNTEQTSEVKREYIDGYVYAMAGAKRNHNLLTMNVARRFGNHLEESPCVTFASDMKVKVGNNYFYPDVVVDCNSADGEELFIDSPWIIVEVISHSTRKNDTSIKFIRYINLPTLEEYVLIEQDVVSIQVFRKNNDWKPSFYCMGDSVTFESISLILTVEEIYDRVANKELEEFRRLNQSLDDEHGHL